MECDRYRACEWVAADGQCYMKSNTVAGYVTVGDPVITPTGYQVTNKLSFSVNLNYNVLHNLKNTLQYFLCQVMLTDMSEPKVGNKFFYGCFGNELGKNKRTISPKALNYLKQIHVHIYSIWPMLLSVLLYNISIYIQSSSSSKF